MRMEPPAKCMHALAVCDGTLTLQEVIGCKVNDGANRLVKVRRYRAMRMPTGRTTMNEMLASKPWVLALCLKSVKACLAEPSSWLDIIAA